MNRLLALVLLFASLLAGCGTLPATIDRSPSTTRIAAADAPLPTLARDLEIPDGLSAVRPMPMPHHALAARLELIAQAHTSLDLQTYLLADDATGHLMLRALRDAALRGVRVRLLLDDMYTQGLDDLLLGLAAYPNVEVRLFNPFVHGRDATVSRLWQLATDFARLNHRMHNKLFIADGTLAVVGGRNLADDYFLRSKQSNFIDFDLLAAGAVMLDLSRHFDAYWNSERVYPLQAIASSRMSPSERRERFEQRSGDGLRATVPGLDEVPRDSALLPASPDIGQGLFGFYVAPAGAHADPPVEVRGEIGAPPPDTVAARLANRLVDAESEIVMVSPYFVPGRFGVQRMKLLRDRGVSVRVVTNATATSDEPAVSLGYEPHREEMLRLGVRLFEVSSTRLKQEMRLRGSLGASTGRLHAKMGFIDRKAFLVGSMNLDARSAFINTEIGMLVLSPELTREMLAYYKIDSMAGMYEVRLRESGEGIEWVARDGDHERRLDSDPESTWMLRMKLRLLSLVVPEELL